MRTRTIATASGKHAVQVVSKRYGALVVHRHIGTYANLAEKSALYEKAKTFIQKSTGQQNLLDFFSSFKISDIAITDSKPLFVYNFLSAAYDKLGLNAYPDQIIKDLVVARIYSPNSKRATCECLRDLFGRKYALKTIYRHLKESMKSRVKDVFQKALIKFAKEKIRDTLKLVFYDVTTLYFESAAKSGIRDFGFSKDHRPQDTQIVVGLVVNHDGFPLYFDVFNGKTFEGNTFLPVIENIQRLLGIRELIVVADAAMISRENINRLASKQIKFIVGARLANLPSHLIHDVAKKIGNEDGKTADFIYHGHRLVCHYSSKRAAKDKADRNKYISRAEKALAAPSKLAHRYRFIRATGKTYSLNAELIAKAKKLEGIKGYITNTFLDSSAIIDRYHDLWRVESAFRLTKDDLEARPIFHRLDETINAHLVIVFAGLAICRYIEIKTGMSIKKVLRLAEKVLTHKVVNKRTGETAYVETTIEDCDLKEKIDLLKSIGY